MILEQYLQNIGLDDKEAKIYLASLQLGPASIQELSKSSGVKRSTVYEVIDALTDKALITISQKGKRKVFTAQEPDNLLLYLKQKENVLAQIMPDLEALKNASANKPTIRIFEGQKGLEQIYEDMIKKSGSIDLLAAPEEMISKGIAEYLKDWHKRRYAAKIPIRFISINNIGDEAMTNEKVAEKESLKVIKYLSKNNYPFTVGTYIYRNKVAFVSFGEKEMVGIIIRSPEINKTMKMIFEFFWR